MSHLPDIGPRIDPREVEATILGELGVGWHDMDNVDWGGDYRWSTTDKLLVVGTRPVVDRWTSGVREHVDLRPRVGDLLSSRYQDEEALRNGIVKVGVAIFVRVELQDDPPGGYWGWVRPVGWFPVVVEEETRVAKSTNWLDSFSVEYTPPR